MNVNADQNLNAIKDLNQYAENQTEKTNLICPDCSPVKNCSPILFIDGRACYVDNDHLSQWGIRKLLTSTLERLMKEETSQN